VHTTHKTCHQPIKERSTFKFGARYFDVVLEFYRQPDCWGFVSRGMLTVLFHHRLKYCQRGGGCLVWLQTKEARDERDRGCREDALAGLLSSDVSVSCVGVYMISE